MHDLQLLRDMTPLFTRAWSVFHRIVEGSPLYGASPASLEKDEVELVVTLMGLDEHTGQQVHARYRYMASDFAFGARHADMLSELSPTRIQLDLSKFDDLMATQRTDAFPYT
jgi:inward rectifier potassium channel